MPLLVIWKWANHSKHLRIYLAATIVSLIVIIFLRSILWPLVAIFLGILVLKYFLEKIFSLAKGKPATAIINVIIVLVVIILITKCLSIIGTVLMSGGSEKSTRTNIQTPKTTVGRNTISTTTAPSVINFNDIQNEWCSSRLTDLQRQTMFDKYKNKYFTWTGEVESVSESWGSLKLQVTHCLQYGVMSDIIVTMKNDQKEKLLKLHKGDTVTYKAKFTRFDELGLLSAEDGEIVER